MKLLLAKVVIVTLIPLWGFCEQLPSYLSPCGKDNPQLNQCLLNRSGTILPRLKEGISVLYLPPITPFVIREINVHLPQGLNASFSNIKVYGLQNLEVPDLNLQLEKNIFDITIVVPKIDVETDYSLSGNIVGLQLNGQGSAVANFTNPSGNITTYFERYMKKGHEYMRIKALTLNMDPGKVKLEFKNLFGNDIKATEQANKIINDNLAAIIETSRPIIDDVLKEVMITGSKRHFGKYPIDELFP